MATEDGIFHLPGQRGEILWDCRFSPVFMANSYGAWDEEQVVQWYTNRNQHFDRAIAKGQLVYLISDISNLDAPDANMRKRLGEFGHKYDTPYKGKWIGQTFIMTNPVLRGVVTAVNWLNPNGFVAPTTTAPTMSRAIDLMRSVYQRADHMAPELSDDYSYPAFSPSPNAPKPKR